MFILYPLSIVGMFICTIMVLIPLFKTKGVLHGILGIICGLYPFIWGWIHAKELNLSKIMLIWSVCIGIAAVSGTVVFAGMSKQVMEAAQKAQQEAAQKAQPK